MNRNIFLIVLVFIATVGFIGCSGGKNDADGKKSGSDTTANVTTGTTAVELEKGEADLGKITVGDTIYHAFKFKVTGKNALILDGEPKVSCECTKIVYYPKGPVKPGATDSIRMQYASKDKFLGHQNKSIRMKANTEPPITKMSFKLEVLPKK
jgi:hypothetical protein